MDEGDGRPRKERGKKLEIENNKIKNKMVKDKKYISRKIGSLMFLICSGSFLISCNWNSSEKGGQAMNLPDTLEIEEKSSPYVVDVKAMDYAFGIPEEIPSGWVTFRMKNMGKEEHVAVVVKFTDTVTHEELNKLIINTVSEGDLEAFRPVWMRMERDMGGPGLLSPNHTGETTVFLEPGVYALSCGVQSADGEYHWQKGMMRAFKVTEEKTDAAKPEKTVDVILSNFAISTKNPIAEGRNIFNVKFTDMDYHDVHLVKLAPGQHMKDLKEWMNHVKAPSPYEFLGGAEQVPEGMTSTFTANLEPGRYAFVSHFYAASGMAEEFFISESENASVIDNAVVNDKVIIESNFFGTNLPEKLKEGRTEIVLKNTGRKEYNFHLTSLKDQYSVEDYRNFIQTVYVDEEPHPKGIAEPNNFLFYNSIKPGEQESFNIEIEDDKKYFLIGPLVPGKRWKFQWRNNNMIHKMEGTHKKN